MASRIFWSSDDRICLIVEFQGGLTWTEFSQRINEAHKMIAAVDHSVSLIIWDKAGLPPGNPLSHFQSALKLQPPNVEGVIVIPTQMPGTMRAFMKRLIEVTDRLHPSKSSIMFANTLDEALKLVNRVAIR